MNLNATLLGQMITFALFIWFTVKYVWPPITAAMQERRKKIAEGLAFADKAKHDLELAEHQSVKIIRDAKLEASQVIEHANKRALQIVEEAKENARGEGQRIINQAGDEVEQLAASARRELHKQVASLSLSMAEKLVERDLDDEGHRLFLDKMVEEI